MLAEGLSNKQIAAALEISEHTAKFHVNSILGKLGAGTRTEAVMRGLSCRIDKGLGFEARSARPLQDEISVEAPGLNDDRIWCANAAAGTGRFAPQEDLPQE